MPVKVKAAYPDCNFVPVYWMASEDPRLPEISYFKLYGKNMFENHSNRSSWPFFQRIL